MFPIFDIPSRVLFETAIFHREIDYVLRIISIVILAKFYLYINVDKEINKIIDEKIGEIMDIKRKSWISSSYSKGQNNNKDHLDLI